MKTIASQRTITASEDGTGLLSHAGSLLLLKTLRVTGLDRKLSAHLERWRTARAMHDPGKIATDSDDVDERFPAGADPAPD
ncbi:unnamed protein product [[Actinomadura] parvosata subsp. kistnae]|uniref:Uncharacterized protein n=1 Tax=[Actinomadura] parvosata subsp. kistnae TaxID=1909395 RepID=A0A1U9ZX60_9ACTN|nr:transposase [Nonomuraea sp. ATCC 55076]AQZ62527.1 hypothetical protein BKM31_14595 [Nonomuraea sp. ATCC 55076]SPL88780.1 unnamed protein product [Actinomadura parvosata subsp. kistnae]